MTYASVRAAAQEAAKAGALTPHQLAALGRLDELLTDTQRQEFTELWRAQGSPAAAGDPPWLAPALRLIKAWEGLRLEAYRCPAGVPTIGYGSTRVDGRAVRMGDTITESQAEALLRRELVELFGPSVMTLLPLAQKWRPEQQAALVSFAFNVGLGAVEESTLRKRLLAGEPPERVVAEELPKWVHAGEAVLAGLERRRAAEVALFVGGSKPPAPSAPPSSVLLKVPFFSQHDNASGQGSRECASSSAAMVAAYWGALASDDAYNVIRARYGDTTDVDAQVRALRYLGLDARFRTDCSPATLEAELRAGRPVMVGWLHQGAVTAPKGGGHWSVVIGFTPEAWIHNDPNGEANLVGGGYVSSAGGAGVAYSRRNWNRRWLPDGKGWAILAKPQGG